MLKRPMKQDTRTFSQKFHDFFTTRMLVGIIFGLLGILFTRMIGLS